MDFSKLRATALREGDDEEAVTVNTRALIDKVLARYSGEWTTLRELIQNAADAQATTVTIKFETLPSTTVPIPNTSNDSERLRHVLLNHTLKRLLVTNNGQNFGVNDWSRLKRIAEGNPDETKIGAFGVGFYSVFADCEEPFVSSGNEAMAFYWKGNSLFTRRLQLPAEQGNPNTSFVLDYRNETTPMPNLLSIAQFLATSLTFVALQHIELWVDDWRIVSLQKKTAPSIDVPIAKDVETKTKDGLMNVRSMERESVQMDATFMNVIGWKPSVSASVSRPGYDNNYGGASNEVPSLRSFFSRLTSTSNQNQLKTKAAREEKAFQEIVLEDLTAITTANVFLRVTTAVVKTSVTANFAAELERATKKPPPKTTKMAILTSSYDETAASAQNAVAKGVDIFASVLPSKKPGGRIFIGFPTHQTTGAGMHLSAPSVIPTVERESIDLNARWVRTWNQEMLRVAGIMARLAFSNEMADLAVKLKRATELAGHGTKVGKEEVNQFIPEALHTLKTFTFEASTPSSQVAQLIEEAFWTAYKQPSIEIYSTRGVLSTKSVRIATEDLSGFVEGIPVVPESLVSSVMVQKLRDFGLLTEITVKDVKQELEAKALTKEQLVQFITWIGRKAITGSIDGPTIHSLMDVAVAMIGEKEGSGDILALGSIKNYLAVNKIPAEVPIPPTTIPFQFTRLASINELQALGWEPLEIVPWLRFLIEMNAHRPAEQSLTSSVPFSAHVLQILSKSWEGLSQSSKTTIVSLIQPIAMIPTKAGMKKPADAFFANVKLFDDLPTVTSCPGVKEKFLAAIGVRKTVDLETIFTRLLAPVEDNTQDPKLSRGTNSRHMELIKYLASVREDIPAEDMKRLKSSHLCPSEAGLPGQESTQGSAKLYKVSELYEPKDSLRELGLPIIQWPGPPGSYRIGSIEGRFLTSLGLKPYPSVPELLEMMASNDDVLRKKAMHYFLANHHINGYVSFEVGTSKEKFLPLQDENRRVSPAECFTNEKCAVLGFSILKKELVPHAGKFGVAIDPPINECINRLVAKPPSTKQEATTLFRYFSDRLGELGQNSVARLGDAKIVPVAPKTVGSGLPEKPLSTDSKLEHLSPRQCYLGTSNTYGDIFDFVDFGNQANAFLMKCGSKSEPTTHEIATFACREPAKLLTIMRSQEKYIHMLRNLAEELPQLKKDKNLFKQMKQAKWLLGLVYIVSDKKKSTPKNIQTGDDQYDSDPEDNEDGRIEELRLAAPSEIVIIDDYAAFRLFKNSLLSCPQEEALESFYLALGAEKLSSLEQRSLRLGPVLGNQAAAISIRSHILERSKLFLYEYKRDAIRHDVRWLEKNLSVQMVSSIALRRSLKGYTLSHTEKRSASLGDDKRTESTLFLVSSEGTDSYQISQSLCALLLERPNQNALLTFESFLHLNLYQLRSRGYNVERILRAKAAEQRIAEEERRKQLEVEQRELREKEEQWRKQAQSQAVNASARDARPTTAEMPVPGAFGGESPEPSPQPAQRGKRGLFSGLTKRLGINNASTSNNAEAQEQLSNFLGGNNPPKDNPPTYDEAANGAKVSSPAALQQNLLNAIQSSRAYGSDSLFSPPSTSNIKEQATYCDSTPAQNLVFLAKASNGVKIYIDKSLSGPTSSSFLGVNVAGLNSFANLLYDVADIYSLSRAAIHIFSDEVGGTIAFNSNGSIFCNFRFFKQLHEARMDGEGKTVAGSYWWIVVAHELAHNVVKPHSSEHSFYTEMLVANYFPKMMAKCGAWLQSTGPAQLDAPRAEGRLVDVE